MQNVLDHLRRLHHNAETAQPSDRKVLRALATNRDQDAFAVVARRHAATVVKRKMGVAVALLLGLAAGRAAMLTPQRTTPAPQPERLADPPKVEEKSVRRVDRYGDPLPPGAIARLGTLRFRTPGQIVALAFAPDGKTLAVSTYDSIFLFDAASGKKIKQLPVVLAQTAIRNRSAENPIVFSSDGKFLISKEHKAADQSSVPVVRVWEWAGEGKPKEYEIGQWIAWVGWTAEGQPLALRVEDNGSLHLHDLSTGRSRRFVCAKPYKYPFGDISWHPLVACSPRSHTLAVPDKEYVIHVWDTTNGRERCTFQLKGDSQVYSLTFSPDGSWLVATTGTTVQMWDAAKGKRAYSVNMKMNYDHPVFTADGKMLAIPDSAERIHFLDAATGKELGRNQAKEDFDAGFLFSHSNGKWFDFSPDGKWLVTSRRNGNTVHVWDVATGKRNAEPVGHTSPPRAAVFAPDGRRVATGGGIDGTFRLWDSKTAEPLLCIQQPGTASQCAFSADGKTLWSAWSFSRPQSGDLQLYDATTGQQKHVLKLEDPDRPDTYQSILWMHQSDDGERLVALSEYHPKVITTGPDYWEFLITGWDAKNRKELFRRRCPRIDFGGYALAPDARVLAVAHPGGPLFNPLPGKGPMRLEDVATGELLLKFPTLEGLTFPLAFSPDGRLLVSHDPKGIGKSDDSKAIMHLWETATAAEVPSPQAGGSTSLVAFSPDGRLLALTAPGQPIRLYDLFDHRERQCFKGFDAEVTCLAFSPDGQRLVSGLSDSTYLVWEVSAPAPPRKLGAEEAVKAWADLARTDAPRAFRARYALAAAPAEALKLLTERLHPAKAADPQLLRGLLTDLESEQRSVREKAQKELENLADLAEPALRQAMNNKSTMELRRRVQALLERLRGPVTRPELLQALRAVAVLEDIGTPEARRLLEQLAKGAPEARLTREAKASLRRLDLRKPDKP